MIDGGVVRLDIGAQHETLVRELRVHVTHRGIVSAMVHEVGAGGGVLAESVSTDCSVSGRSEPNVGRRLSIQADLKVQLYDLS